MSDDHKTTDERVEQNSKRSRSAKKIGSLGRRQYLQGVGAAVVGASFASSVQAASYTTIELSDGDSVQYYTSQDDLSNTRIIPNGATIEVTVDSGGYWENFAIDEGTHQGQAGSAGIFNIQVPDGEKFVLDNYYIGGSASGGRDKNDDSSTVVFNSIDHAGEAEFKNGFVTDWYQPYYCSNSGNPPDRNSDHEGYGGDIIFRNLYTERFAHTAYRLGTDGSKCIDCVVANPYESDGPARSAWAYLNNPTYDNLQFATQIVSGSQHDEDAKAHLIDCEGTGGDMTSGGYTGDAPTDGADLSVPSGVPTSPDEAASGGPNSDPEPSPGTPHDLIVDGSLDSTSASYDFSVTGDVTTMDDPQGDNASGSTASGGVGGYKDGYEFSGDVSTLNVEVGDGYISANVDRANREITFQAGSNADYIHYTATVSGDITPKSGIDGGDNINDAGDSVSGGVADGATEVFSYTGELELLDLDDSTCIIDVTRSHVLTIDDIDDDGATADYSLSVTGSLEQTDAYDATVDSNDSVSGGSASGQVTNGRDSYRFTGEITDFSVDADIDALIDGDEIITDSLGHNVINMNGTGDAQEYQFSVVGGAGAYDGTSGSDTVSDRTISGTVWDGSTDSYDYRNGVFVGGFTDGGTNPTYSDR
jgi:hypothetical protein